MSGADASLVSSSAPNRQGGCNFNPLDHPIIFSLPRRLTPVSAWHEHIPFAMYLVSLLRPNMLVELGTHGGDSYCAFCQAVQELNLDTRCYAVDTWGGDPHSGNYGAEILNDLSAFHDPLYGSFSQLIQSTFSVARDHFPDGSIDLLHLDGYHTYEAARADLEPWLGKLSPRGVILLHDVNARERDFGVWRLWDELALRYPHWEVYHGHGLGVLAVGPAAAQVLDPLINASAQESNRIRAFFFRLAQGLTTAKMLAEETKVSETQQIEMLARELRTQAEVNASLIAQLNAKQYAEEQVQILTAELSELHERQAREQLADRNRIAALEQTIAEQIQHLDALAARIERMTMRETELRTLLLEAHAELWSRDRELDQVVAAASPLSPQASAMQASAIEFLQAENANLDQIVIARDKGIQWLRSELEIAQGEVRAMQSSRLWRMGTRYRNLKHRMLAGLGIKR